MDDASRYKLISSFYGPGTVGCWLFTVCSVVVSWTLNRTYKTKDSVDNDFIALLLYTVIVTGHLLYQVARFPGSRAHILTTRDEALIPYTVAIEASLCVCELFTYLAIGLYLIAARNCQMKRASAILYIAIICLLIEMKSFFRGPMVGPSFLACLSWMVLPTILILVVVGAGIHLTHFKFREYYNKWRMIRHSPIHVESRMGQVISAMLAWCCFTVVTILFSPSSKTYWDQPSRFLALSPLFFIPTTNISVGELDQAVALAAGAITLAFSLFHAFRSQSSARRWKSPLLV